MLFNSHVKNWSHTINRDRAVTHSQNSIKLGSNKRNTRLLRGLSKSLVCDLYGADLIKTIFKPLSPNFKKSNVTHKKEVKVHNKVRVQLHSLQAQLKMEGEEQKY